MSSLICFTALLQLGKQLSQCNREAAVEKGHVAAAEWSSFPLLPFLPRAGVCYSLRYIARQMRILVLVKTIFPPLSWASFLINCPGVDHLGWSCENRNGSERGRKEGNQGLRQYGKQEQNCFSRCFHSCLIKMVLCYVSACL